jgi:hypothetical protein
LKRKLLAESAPKREIPFLFAGLFQESHVRVAAQEPRRQAGGGFQVVSLERLSSDEQRLCPGYRESRSQDRLLASVICGICEIFTSYLRFLGSITSRVSRQRDSDSPFL